MAHTVPETIRSSATTGERLVFRTLKRYLPDDYIVYFEPNIHGRRPDFVIIGPDLGLIVLEVKDYTRSTLYQLNNDEWIITPANESQKKVKSPFLQARENMFKQRSKSDSARRKICDNVKIPLWLRRYFYTTDTR